MRLCVCACVRAMRVNEWSMRKCQKRPIIQQKRPKTRQMSASCAAVSCKHVGSEVCVSVKGGLSYSKRDLKHGKRDLKHKNIGRERKNEREREG